MTFHPMLYRTVYTRAILGSSLLSAHLNKFTRDGALRKVWTRGFWDKGAALSALTLLLRHYRVSHRVGSRNWTSAAS
jgi:hypothetical protein